VLQRGGAAGGRRLNLRAERRGDEQEGGGKRRAGWKSGTEAVGQGVGKK